MKVTSNNEYDWTSKISEHLHHNRTDIVDIKILQKHYQLPILGTLDMSGHFHQKQLCQLVETLLFICMQKMNSIPNCLF